MNEEECIGEDAGSGFRIGDLLNGRRCAAGFGSGRDTVFWQWNNHHGAVFVTGTYNEQTVNGAISYVRLEGHKSNYNSANGYYPIYLAKAELTPYDGKKDGKTDMLIEDTERCVEFSFTDPRSNSVSTIISNKIPDGDQHYGNSKTVTYSLGLDVGSKSETGQVSGSASISWSTTYWETNIKFDGGGSTAYYVRGDIEGGKDQARTFTAGCAVQKQQSGRQTIDLDVTCHFERPGIWGKDYHTGVTWSNWGFYI